MCVRLQSLRCTGSQVLWAQYQSTAQWGLSVFLVIIAWSIALGMHRNNNQLKLARELLHSLEEARQVAVRANATKSDFLAFLVGPSLLPSLLLLLLSVGRWWRQLSC